MTLVCSSNHIRVQRPQICQNWVVDRLLHFNANINYFEAPPYWPPSWIACSQMTLMCSSNHIRVQQPQICQNWVVDRLFHFNTNINYFETPPYWPPSWIAHSQMTLVCSSNHIRVQRPLICQNWVVNWLLHFNSNINYFEAPPFWIARSQMTLVWSSNNIRV